ncbi:MAG: nucleotidyltransferase domain-containing protein [Candidatus Kapabacteria bacterium]|nr:nucleotidyltransferase domain-containing protein [Candidatus Kapabacteria bacterium]
MKQKEQNILRRIKDCVRQKSPDAEIILFGSRARGESNKDSDWDILILLRQSIVNHSLEREYRDELYNIELSIGQSVSALIFSKNEWENKHRVTPLFDNIQREGINL